MSVESVTLGKADAANPDVSPWQDRGIALAADHFFNPPRPCHVWHMDKTVICKLWMRFEVGAIINRYSSKIVGLKAVGGSPATAELITLFDGAVNHNASPRFIVTDRGGQFQMMFRAAIAMRGDCHACGQPLLGYRN